MTGPGADRGGSGATLGTALPDETAARFAITAPVAALAAGSLLLVAGLDGVTTHWAPQTLALTHLGTLGFLTFGLLGLLWPSIPTAPGNPARRARLGVFVYTALLLGVAGLVTGLLAGAPKLLFAALGFLLFGMLSFLIPAALALRRASADTAAARGRRLAVLSLFAAAVLGLWMAHGVVGVAFPGPRPLWIQVHLCAGFFGWVGTLLVVLNRPSPDRDAPSVERRQRTTLALIALGVALPLVVLAFHYAGAFGDRTDWARLAAAAGAVPAAFAVWWREPRARARAGSPGGSADPGAGLRRGADRVALACAVVAVFAFVASDPRIPLLLGWLAIWGWGGLHLHALLLEHLPALRSGKSLDVVPARLRRIGLWLHVAAVVVGALAIVAGNDAGARLAGALVVATSLALLDSLRRQWRAGSPAGAGRAV